MDQRAEAVPGAYVIVAIDPLGWLHFDCTDHEAYKAMPAVIRHARRQYVRRGWNSDRGVCYYEPGGDASIAYAEQLVQLAGG